MNNYVDKTDSFDIEKTDMYMHFDIFGRIGTGQIGKSDNGSIHNSYC